MRTYATGSREETAAELAEATNELMEALTLNATVTSNMPLYAQLQRVSTIQIFMHTMMGTIVVFLGILCVQLIYSLMLSDVEEKTFEFGMLRALGFNTRNIMITIIMQSFTFSVPGLMSGLLVAALLNLVARKILYMLVENEGAYSLSSGSLWIGMTLGLLLPLLSNIIPI